MTKTILEQEIAEDAVAFKNALKAFTPPPFSLKNKKLFFVACGTAYHACLQAKLILQTHGILAQCELANEFNFFPQIFDEKTVFIFVSQSGETADTLRSLEIAKAAGAKTIAICNSTGSTLSKEAHFCLYTHAGKEQAIAATKSYIAQLAVLYALCLTILGQDVSQDDMSSNAAIKQLSDLENSIKEQLKINPSTTLVKKIAACENLFFIGKGFDLACAYEAALKLKETAYVNCIGIGAGELRHGSLALISKKSVVVAIINDAAVTDKVKAAVMQARKNGAYTAVVSCLDKTLFADCCNTFIPLQKVSPKFCAATTLVPLQKLALQTSLAKGLDPDNPRSLVKSVTISG